MSVQGVLILQALVWLSINIKLIFKEITLIIEVKLWPLLKGLGLNNSKLIFYSIIEISRCARDDSRFREEMGRKRGRQSRPLFLPHLNTAGRHSDHREESLVIGQLFYFLNI